MAAGLGLTTLAPAPGQAASTGRALLPDQRRWLLATLAKEDKY
jgi:hypothetical protein